MELESTELTIVFLIASNVITMSMYYWSPIPPDTSYSATLEVFNVLFLLLFLIEALLKIIGWGFRQYWTSSWNQFDFVIFN